MLGEDAQKRIGEAEGIKPHVEQAGNRLRRRGGVQGGEDRGGTHQYDWDLQRDYGWDCAVAEMAKNPIDSYCR